MSDIAIKVQNLSKRYRIGLEAEMHESFGGLLFSWIKSPVRNYRKLRKLVHFDENEDDSDIIWALKDVSFEVKEGEVLGIIGKNGAGKSTLLKILSRIVEPTSGCAEIKGSVSSLLEVGTGFHPELTGRENIYLNSAILGMKKQEIDSKFDEIVQFSGIGKFLDTPIKRYSSGMKVRLAFSVAAHLEPEILLIDEVLAVGDVEFQKKCLGKIEDVVGAGRTVLFVSHNLASVKALCKKSLLLKEGQIAFIGDTEDAIKIYTKESMLKKNNIKISEKERKQGVELSLQAKIIEFKIISCNQESPSVLDSSKPFKVVFEIETEYKILRCGIQFIISDYTQNLILFDSASMHGIIYELKRGINQVECQVDPLYLCAGKYKISCVLSLPNQGVIDSVPDAYSFTVSELDPYKTGFNLERSYGFAVYHVHHQWLELKHSIK